MMFLYIFQFLALNAKPESPPATGVYIDGLWLNNAAWDGNKSSLKPCQNGYERFNTMPVIWLKPVTLADWQKLHSDVKYQLYDAPILFSPGTKCLKWTNIIASLQLPTLHKASLWGERRVYLTCSLKKLSS
jgi:hypothetical protein